MPQRIAAAHPEALFVHFDGVAVDLPGNPALVASFEKFGALFAWLQAAGVAEVVFAGGLARPALDPAKFDARTMQLAPGFMAAMAGGDDGLLRAVIAAFEAEGFVVRGAHEVVAGLTAEPGLICGPAPGALDLADAARARAILTALGPLDVGQGAVVALGFVAQTPEKLRHRARGVLVKAPKPGQDLGIDMPAIGPATITAAAQAGLAGIVIDAGRVLVLDRAAVLDAAKAAGLFLLAQTP